MRDAASLNQLVRGVLSADEGNRVSVPDVVIVVSTSLYQPRDVNAGELLVRPLSPTHVFLVTIGNGAPIERYMRAVPFAATTTRLAALNFESLADLKVPLCESVNSFLGAAFRGLMRTARALSRSLARLLSFVCIRAI